MKLRLTFSLLCTAAVLGLAGCSSEPPTFPVAGTVTQAGSPIEGAAVSFIPESGGESAVGITDASGKYQLKTKTRNGAFPGLYKVAIAKYQGGTKSSAATSAPAADPYDITKEYPEDYNEAAEAEKSAKVTSTNSLPKRYADANSSELTAKVMEGENTHDFELEKK